MSMRLWGMHMKQTRRKCFTSIIKHLQKFTLQNNYLPCILFSHIFQVRCRFETVLENMFFKDLHWNISLKLITHFNHPTLKWGYTNYLSLVYVFLRKTLNGVNLFHSQSLNSRLPLTSSVTLGWLVSLLEC